MTEQDLDQLFYKSKEKQTVKTEQQENYNPHKVKHLMLNNQHTPLPRDFTHTKFLKMESDYDKLLTGLPSNHQLDK